MKDETTKLKEEQLIEMVESFCEECVDEEYKDLSVKLVEKLGRKQDVPFKRGKLEIWASAVIYSLGQINFLFDDSFDPYLTPKDICNYFNTKQSTVSDKARKIRVMFNMGHYDEEFSTNNLKGTNNFVVDADSGLIVPESMLSTNNVTLLSLFSEVMEMDEEEIKEVLVESFLENNDKKDLEDYLDMISTSIPDDMIEDYLDMFFNTASINNNENEESHLLETIEQCEEFIDDFHEKMGDEYFEENKGHFWQIFETREFMSALLHLSILLFEDNQDHKAIEQLEYILELNPNDNQGVRYLLITNLLKLNLLEKVENLMDFYDEEYSTTWNFSKLLLAIKNNEDENTIKELYGEAINSNNYVVPFLLGDEKISDDEPSFYSEGSEEEAISYLDFALDVWKNDKTAMKILNKFN